MTNFLARHRAAFGILSVLALAAGYPSISGLPLPALIAAFALFLLGLVVLVGSPYLSILYREAPLKRAMTGLTDLDERELALRDRAAGMTYYLLALITLLLIGGAGIAARAGWVALDGAGLIGAIVPYGWFAFSLPLIMLEWFEPSGRWAAPLDEEEA